MTAGGRSRELSEGDPLIGRVIDGRYRIQERLGAGGLGVVYRAQHIPIGRTVALKVLHEDLGAIKDVRRRFEREARALSSLSHPHIVSMSDYGVAGSMPYLTMELLEGRTLEQLLEQGPLEPQRALDIQRQVLLALSFAHARGVMHRDLTPANVFLQNLQDLKDHVKILDFGFAKFIDPDESEGEPTLTQAGTVFGTPAYMSPEQASGAKADARADIYSAGILFFEMLTGRCPFIGATRKDLLRAHVRSPLPGLREVRPELEPRPELERLLHTAMAKEPSDRFQDGSQMLAALDALPAPIATVNPDLAVKAPPPSPPAMAPAAGQTYELQDFSEVSVTSMRRDSRRAQRRANLGTAGMVLLVLAGLALLFGIAFKLVGTRGTSVSTTSETTPKDRAPEPPRVPGDTPPPPQVRPKAEDPWKVADLPTELDVFRSRLEAGDIRSRKDFGELYAFVRAHPMDARAFVLMGRGFVEMTWYSAAIPRYVRAYRLDPRVRGDTHMLNDLVSMATKPLTAAKATEALQEIYGLEATGAVDERIASEKNPDALARLRTLRSGLMR